MANLANINIKPVEFKNHALTEKTSYLYSTAVSMSNNVNFAVHEMSCTLALIERDKLYLDDGFKTLADYGDKIGLEKSMTYLLARAGAIYSDDSIPDDIKDMTPSNLAEISSILNGKDEDKKAKVMADAIRGDLKGMTQKDLRDYASKIKNEGKAPSLSKMARLKFISDNMNPSAHIRIDYVNGVDTADGYNVSLIDGVYTADEPVYYPLDVIKDVVDLYPAGTYTESQVNGKVKDIKRYVLDMGGVPYFVYFEDKPKETKRNGKTLSTGKVEKKFTREELISMLAADKKFTRDELFAMLAAGDDN